MLESEAAEMLELTGSLGYSKRWLYFPHANWNMHGTMYNIFGNDPHQYRNIIQFKAVELAFNSLRLATVIRVPTILWGESLVPKIYNRSNMPRDPDTQTLIKIVFNGRPPPFLLFNNPVYVGKTTPASEHLHFWIGGSVANKGLRILLGNVRSPFYGNIVETLSRIYRAGPASVDSESEHVISLVGVSIDVPYSVRGGRIQFNPSSTVLVIHLLPEDRDKPVDYSVGENKDLRTNIYNGHIMPYPQRISTHYAQVTITDIRYVTLHNSPAWLVNLRP